MKKRSDVLHNHPSLIPVAGNFDRKPRTLERDVTTVGRARGTDLCLEANEISTLHCIIYRAPEGYRIRDCNSRTGTRINGASLKSQALHDGDIINLGPFSFEFRLPPAMFPDAVKLDPVQIEHLRQSRRKLAERALKMRRLVRDSDHGASAREAELAHKATQLKEKIRAYDHRLHDLEEAENELTEEHNKLARDAEAHRAHVQQVEGKLADRLAKADEEIHQRWQEFQVRCQAEENRLQALAAAASHGSATATAPDASLLDGQQRLIQQQQQLDRERQEFLAMKEQWVNDQGQTASSLDEQKSALAHQEAALRSQKAELMRMMGNLKKMQEDLRKQAKGDVTPLHEEIERLQKANDELQLQINGQTNDAEVQALADENDKLRAMLHEWEQKGAASANVADLQAELDLLREELQLKDAELEQMQHQPHANGASDAQVHAENELLKKLLQEKSELIDEMGKKAHGHPKNENDLERYEAELNEYRRQLETDRAKLNKEVETLRERNKELDEAVREMEMEMSKERAELGRERQRLERVRDEIKGDMERLQREIAVRDSMAPVQKLREEMTGKPSAPSKVEKSLNDRLRGLRNQLADK